MISAKRQAKSLMSLVAAIDAGHAVFRQRPDAVIAAVIDMIGVIAAQKK